MSFSSGPLTPDWPLIATGRLTGVTCWFRKLWRERKESVSKFFTVLLISPSASICQSLSVCFSVSLQGDAGRPGSVWFRAVSWRRIGFIYSPVCSGPHRLEVSVCFFCFCQSVIHLSHIIGLPLIPSYPQIKRCYPAVSGKRYLTVYLSRSKAFNMVSYVIVSFLKNDYRTIHEMYFKALTNAQQWPSCDGCFTFAFASLSPVIYEKLRPWWGGQKWKIK